jgi:hypothetical protein
VSRNSLIVVSTHSEQIMLTAEGRSRSRMIAMILFAYLLIPPAFFAFWFIDLVAKDYNLPSIQLCAKGILSAGAGLTVVVVVHLVAYGVENAGGRLARWIAAAVGMPAVLGVVFLVYDVDWRPVYVTAATAPLVLLVLWPPARQAHQMVLAGVTAVLITFAGGYSELEKTRLSRYETQLRDGCWCCGYKQRAIHELTGLGAKGQAAIRRCTRAEPLQEGQIMAEVENSRRAEEPAQQ